MVLISDFCGRISGEIFLFVLSTLSFILYSDVGTRSSCSAPAISPHSWHFNFCQDFNAYEIDDIGSLLLSLWIYSFISFGWETFFGHDSLLFFYVPFFTPFLSLLLQPDQFWVLKCSWRSKYLHNYWITWEWIPIMFFTL